MKKHKRVKRMQPTKSKHSIDEFLGIIPMSSIERVMGAREFKKFNDFMAGQTVMMIYEQGGVYYNDLLRFLNNINDRTLYD